MRFPAARIWTTAASHARTLPCRTMSAKSDMGQLVRMMPLDVLVPVNATLGLVLPAGAVPARDHTPFSDFVTIHGMRDRIEVMTSLQKPKKAGHCRTRPPQLWEPH